MKTLLESKSIIYVPEVFLLQCSGKPGFLLLDGWKTILEQLAPLGGKPV